MARKEDLFKLDEQDIHRLIFEEQDEPEEVPNNEGFGIEDEGSDIEDTPTEVQTSSGESDESSSSEDSSEKRP